MTVKGTVRLVKSGLLINFRLSLLKFLLVSIHIFLMFSGKFVWKATERTIFLLQTDLCAAMRAFHLLFLLMKIVFMAGCIIHTFFITQIPVIQTVLINLISLIRSQMKMFQQQRV